VRAAEITGSGAYSRGDDPVRGSPFTGPRRARESGRRHRRPRAGGGRRVRRCSPRARGVRPARGRPSATGGGVVRPGKEPGVRRRVAGQRATPGRRRAGRPCAHRESAAPWLGPPLTTAVAGGCTEAAADGTPGEFSRAAWFRSDSSMSGALGAVGRTIIAAAAISPAPPIPAAAALAICIPRFGLVAAVYALNGVVTESTAAAATLSPDLLELFSPSRGFPASTFPGVDIFRIPFRWRTTRCVDAASAGETTAKSHVPPLHLVRNG
jgi:hypothetical protein